MYALTFCRWCAAPVIGRNQHGAEAEEDGRDKRAISAGEFDKIGEKVDIDFEPQRLNVVKNAMV